DPAPARHGMATSPQRIARQLVFIQSSKGTGIQSSGILWRLPTNASTSCREMSVRAHSESELVCFSGLVLLILVAMCSARFQLDGASRSELPPEEVGRHSCQHDQNSESRCPRR